MSASLDRRDGPHPSHQRVEIVGRHLAVVDVPRHRQVERAAVAIDALGQRRLELGIGPGADALLPVRGDVARRHLAERTLENVAAFALPGLVVLRAVRTARMAFHAMRDGGEIETALERLVQVGVAERLRAAWNELGVRSRLIDRRRDAHH